MSLCAEFEGRAAFAVVYLEEAHPTDGWMYPAVRHFVAQHTALGERRAAAAILQQEMEAILHKEEEEEQQQQKPAASTSSSSLTPPASLPRLLVDTMENKASLAFGALPERLAIVVNGRVHFLGGKGPEMYSVADCRAALAKLLGT